MNYQAGATEQRILHLETADPQRPRTRLRSRTTSSTPRHRAAQPPPNPAADCVTVNSRFAWNHGYYSPDIDITWSSFVGPGVKRRHRRPSPASGWPAVSGSRRWGARPRLQHTRHVGRRDRHPPDDALRSGPHRRLRDGRSRDHAALQRQRWPQADRGPRRLLQAARRRRPVRHVDPGGLDRGTGERLQVGRHEVRRHRRKAVDARIPT